MKGWSVVDQLITLAQAKVGALVPAANYYKRSPNFDRDALLALTEDHPSIGVAYVAVRAAGHTWRGSHHKETGRFRFFVTVQRDTLAQAGSDMDEITERLRNIVAEDITQGTQTLTVAAFLGESVEQFSEGKVLIHVLEFEVTGTWQKTI